MNQNGRHRNVAVIETVDEETRADEIIVTAQIFEHTARLRSFEIAADVFRNIKSA